MAEHAKLSASGSQRWLNCPASVRMEEAFPDESSSYADEGSAAHELAELCLRKNTDADKYLGKAFKEYPDYPVDHEMADSVQLYLDYVRGLKGELLVEQRVDFSEWVPEGFGTSDAIVMGQDNDEGIATVIDLKYGKGVRVDAKDNTQAMLYALGALSEYDFIYDCDLFRLVIVQPRLDHISEWDIKRSDLLKWADIVKEKAELTLQEDAPFSPGEKQCRFCRAKANCRALAEHSLQVAAEEFRSVVTPITVKDISQLDNGEIAALLPQLNLIADWIKSVEAYALQELELGRDVPGYKLVAGRSIRKWRDDTEAEQSLRTRLKVSEIFTKNLVSPAQAEKLLGKGHPLLGKLVIKPEGKPTIAPNSDKRPALKSSVEDDFQRVA